MGYNTVVTIINDNFSAIESNPEGFVEAIREGMNNKDSSELLVRFKDSNLGRTVGKVMQAAHADETQVVVVGRNTANRVLSEYYLGMEPEQILRRLADKLGFTVPKKQKVI